MKNDRYRHDREELKELLTQYENLRAGRPNSYIEREGFERLIEHFDEKDKFEEAIVVCDYAINQYPRTAELLLIKANLLIVLRRYEESLELLDEAEELDASDSNVYILQIDAYLALEKQKKADEVMEIALQNFEGDEKLDLLFELSDVFDDYEQFDKVFDCLAMVLKIDPANEEALHKICFWTDHTGRNEESITLCKEILDEQPFNELAWFNLGAAYQGIKLHEKAIDAYEYVIALNDKFENAYRNMGDAHLRLRNYKVAIECLEKVLELSVPDAVVFEAIGHCYDRLEKYPEARLFYKKASFLNAEDPHMHYKVATTYMNEAVWASAIRYLEVALRTNNMQPDYNLAIGQCYMQIGDIEEALTRLGNVVRMRPKNLNGWTELLKCLLQAEYYEDGIEYAQFAYEQTDYKPIFVFYKSIFLFAAGQTKEASLELENGMMLNPRLLKKFIQLNPTILKYRQVVEIIARFKKKHK
jgi:tetratricopeptide (TPR) repeat protein